MASGDKFPGRVDIGEVFYVKRSGSKTNIRNFMIEANINATIMHSSLRARFVLVDAKNLLEKLRVEVGDAIQYNWTANSQEKTLDLRITKVDNIINMDNQKMFSIECRSNLQYISQFTKISRAYKGTYSDIALSIFEDYAEGSTAAFWEQSEGNRSLVVPNWGPVQTLRWLSENSKAVDDNVNMKFFQACDGTYYFGSVEGIQAAQPEACHTFSYNVSTAYTEKGTPNVQNEYRKIEEINFSPFTDFKDLAPALASTSKVVDLTTKTMKVTNYDYWSQFKNSMNKGVSHSPELMGEGKIFEKAIAKETYTGIEDNNIDNLTQLKKTLLRAGQSITINVMGNAVVDVGKMVNIEIPSGEPVSSTHDGLDELWSGRYIVVAKKEIHRKEKHSMALTLVKDSFRNEGYRNV